MIKNYTIITVLLFSGICSYAQKDISLDRQRASFGLEGKTLKGFRTTFDFSTEKIRRDWWKYTKGFARPVNMKSYYRVEVPSEATDGNVDILIYTQTTEENGTTLFKIGLEEERYLNQAEGLLVGFKKYVFANYYSNLIEEKTGEAMEISEKYNASAKTGEQVIVLNELQEKMKEVDALTASLKEIEKQ